MQCVEARLGAAAHKIRWFISGAGKQPYYAASAEELVGFTREGQRFDARVVCDHGGWVQVGDQLWCREGTYEDQMGYSEILIQDHDFQELLDSQDCSAFDYCLVIPSGSPITSFQIPHNTTFFKCSHNLNLKPQDTKDFYKHHCSEFDIYLNPHIKDDGKSLHECSIIKLPFGMKPPLQMPPPVDINLFAHLTPNATIQGKLCSGNDNSTTKPQKDEIKEHRRMAPKAVIIGLSFGSTGVITAVVIILLLNRRKHKSAGFQIQSRNIHSDAYTNADTNTESGIIYFGVPVFSYEELEQSTNGFDPSGELGKGGFGIVYYGKLKDGREVAVKRLFERSFRHVEQFKNEIHILTRLRHKNLVSLYGCTSRHSRELLLVYEYIPNGTVGCHLHGKLASPGSMPWPTRMRIAVETASALSYLHACDIIHRDVKTSNLLLDNNFCVKVADFGLSRLFPNFLSHVSTAPQGTPGYLDPEYHHCYQLTNKSDVYSFGVVLIELISSLPAIDITRDKDEIKLANLAIKLIQRREFTQLVDSSLGFESDNERDKDMRPSMDEVMEVLQKIESGEDDSEDFGFHGSGISEIKIHASLPTSLGFALSCSNNASPILNLSGTEYIVHEILYNNQSIRVSDAALSSNATDTACLPRTNNLTLDKTIFGVAPNQKDLFLVFGCKLDDGSLPEGFLGYRIGCYAENQTESVLGMRDEGEDLRSALDKCEGGMVRTKMGDEEGRINGEVLRKGFVLNWTVSYCRSCEMTGGKCGFDSEMYTFMCYCPSSDHLVSCPPDPKRPIRNLIIKGIIIGLAGLTTIFLFTVLLLMKRRRYSSSCFLSQSRNIYFDVNPSINPDYVADIFGILVFSYEELVKATNNFDALRELGSGGFGTVYYGKLRDQREVAVKRLYERKRDSKRVKQFMNEIQILTRLRHKNLVTLYGCTSHHSHRLLLVYEYIPNGTVSSHLHGDLAKPAPLPWPIRMKIAIETASALAYLHASGIIHRDVKTNNILLDDNFCVKVADFGISRMSLNDVSHVNTAPQGTMGYVDPEYLESYRLTDKSDVYSFGVVLVELISSLVAVDEKRNVDEIKLANVAMKKIQRREFIELVDPSLGFESDNEIRRMIVSVAELALQCLQRESQLRPCMYEVLEMLQRIESGNKDEHEPLERFMEMNH
ncbi:LEAF RUST 10 DISEASE-RESISTANCE LOCUS RECEPTOR-LIKE PROTEIN KINASE-like 1.2 isoform X1 [Senna tora]|uniref:LEAF RUST 10 DISEASE-RESISTANCE LOCUS RECEPTOR-LIKE PROTEIN KINASE-like 1.2 isoform X1 n=1 Tax=Senna tora TaxID=362788 RepID=A0A834W7Q5_9FABA|nr:LEAF RUST 10 DISEASE-RESISTANCE LOCUS RECEPTOR-LIKE PROTEIN KINASE-like 1.2 isoform X1 [Senna tora]